MVDWNLVSLGVYLALLVVSTVALAVYYIVNKYKPNFMLKATGYLLLSLVVNFAWIMAIRITLLLGNVVTPTMQNTLIIPRVFILASMIYFLYNSTKEVKD